MVHFPLLVIIPSDIYNQGQVSIRNYIENITQPYKQQEVPPYVVMSHDELMDEYLAQGQAYSNVEDYADANGRVYSTDEDVFWNKIHRMVMNSIWKVMSSDITILMGELARPMKMYFVPKYIECFIRLLYDRR